MSENINFDNWFKSLNISYDIHDTYERTILDLLANDVDIAGFNVSHNLIPNNLGFIEKDNNDKYFVDVIIPKTGDITTNFTYYLENSLYDDVKFELIINGIILPINRHTKIVNTCAMYTEFKVRITFLNTPFAVKLTYLCYILNTKLRNDLQYKYFIVNGIKYGNGLALPI